MTLEPAKSPRAGRAALVLAALLAVVLIVRLLIGLPPIVFYGLAGGLIFCLVIIGLDLLHNAARRLDAENGDRPGSNSKR